MEKKNIAVLQGNKKIFLVKGNTFIILKFLLLFSKNLEPLKSLVKKTLNSFFKCSYNVLAGTTCPPEPPVEIKIFSLIWYFLF